MKRVWPVNLIVAGLFLLVGGFVYDATFAGIPYQDPAPEISARYAFHSRIASIFYLSGAGTFVVGLTAYVVRRLVLKFSKRC